MPTRIIQSIITSKITTGFISIWNTENTSVGSSNNNQVKLPLEATGTYNFVVDWGDGQTNTITVWNQAETTHTYASAGIYTIKIYGTLSGFAFANTGDRLKLLEIVNGGDNFNVGSSGGQFYGCANLTSIKNLNTSNVNNMTAFFRACTNLNCALDLNTSIVTTFYTFLYQATSFNYPIAQLDISLATNLNLMLSSATSLSNAYYSDALIAWNSLSHKNTVTLAASAKYEARAAAARTDFINNHSWTINDAGAA